MISHYSVDHIHTHSLTHSNFIGKAPWSAANCALNRICDLEKWLDQWSFLTTNTHTHTDNLNCFPNSFPLNHKWFLPPTSWDNELNWTELNWTELMGKGTKWNWTIWLDCFLLLHQLSQSHLWLFLLSDGVKQSLNRKKKKKKKERKNDWSSDYLHICTSFTTNTHTSADQWSMINDEWWMMVVLPLVGVVPGLGFGLIEGASYNWKPLLFRAHLANIDPFLHTHTCTYTYRLHNWQPVPTATSSPTHNQNKLHVPSYGNGGSPFTWFGLNCVCVCVIVCVRERVIRSSLFQVSSFLLLLHHHSTLFPVTIINSLPHVVPSLQLTHSLQCQQLLWCWRRRRRRRRSG